MQYLKQKITNRHAINIGQKIIIKEKREELPKLYMAKRPSDIENIVKQPNEKLLDVPKNSDYRNQYGNPSTSLASFRDNYSGKPLNQIVIGESSFLGYKFPNDMTKAYRFVNIGNGRQVDMIHFLVVGPRGHFMGITNEIKQIFSNIESAFYPQDLYSNRLGVNFFNSYEALIQQNPNNISTYIYWFLSNPNNINFY